MNKEQFEQEAKKLVNNDEKWMHVLPAIPEQSRSRFIEVLKAGISIPRAYDLILVTAELPDALFRKKLSDVLGKSN